MLSNLLSGAIGAVLGSLVSVLYVHYSERLKSRRQLAIEIIDHIETMYNRLMALATIQIPELVEHRQARGVSLLNDDERRQYTAEFLKLLTTYSPFAKVEIIFNDSTLVTALEKLTSGFQKAFHSMNNRDEFMRMLNAEVDPHYGEMCRLLKSKTR
jgi:hypothetical protein